MTASVIEPCCVICIGRSQVNHMHACYHGELSRAGSQGTKLHSRSDSSLAVLKHLSN